ncbi:PREDICTED: GPI mannosyltransferase 3 [Cyphomyrmex costatus]|uniref:GPI mannosyltransferase 3 n=1 Tax=Cyphomyrmex costatus TaxID=456900 RepID=UPI0008521D26|nr:PREDICTED: GPI mannosyltransferase 3 [Cyphomyrmex costatus]
MRLSTEFGLLSFLILWRLINVIVVRTTHVPDEYWQSLEVAHRLAFSYGYLTWEWTTMIRSYMYPFLISILYRILAILSLDYVLLLTILPRVFQAILVAYADYRFYQWTQNKWMLLSLCLNPFWYYCATRTLINSVETAFTIIALSIYPWRGSHAQNLNYLWIIGFLCMVRPTTAIMWFPLCFRHIFGIYYFQPKKKVLLGRCILIGSTCAIISILVDSYCYGTFVITPWKFFQVNVLRGVGSTYGTNHLVWYFFVALPVLLGSHLFPFLFACYVMYKRPNSYFQEIHMLVVICWTLNIYTLMSHKEFRFILPLLPLLIYTSFAGLNRLLININANVFKIIVAVLMCSNIIVGLFISMIHQCGTLTIMENLRKEITRTNTSLTDTLILTPCHSTPLYSHLHVNISIRFLTCEPNFSNTKNYIDEADQFFANATIWLRDNYINNAKVTLPTYVIAFDKVASEISEFLRTYKLIAKEFYTFRSLTAGNYAENILLYKHV